MVWLSISSRVLINVEALNMVESIGNYTRHRRAPVVIKTEHGYSIRYVPVISGECIAHAFQAHLARISELRNLPVCELCKCEEFIKRGVPDHKPKDWKVDTRLNPKDRAHLYEKKVISECVVEDIGGFLHTGEHTGNVPVRRTSCIMFGYAIPALEDLSQSGIATVEPQFHTRHVKAVARGQREQMIFYVESGSALYVMSCAFDVSRVGETSMVKRELVVDSEQKIKRAEAGLDALYLVLVQGKFGAKQSRFMPDYQVASLVVAVSDRLPFNVKSGHRRTYIRDTLISASAFRTITNSCVRVFAYVDELDRSIVDLPEDKELSLMNSPDELFKEVKHYIVQLLSESMKK